MDDRRYIILGGGAVVHEFYLPAFDQLGWLSRVSVADPSPAACERLRAAFPLASIVESDFRGAVTSAVSEGVHAAIVALPNVLHEAAVALCLESGLDVLCEKPLALDEAACLRLGSQADALGRVLGVALVRRHSPAVDVMRKVLAAGWMGDVESIDVEWGSRFAWPSESGHYFRRENAGVLANLGVHSLDMIEYVFGPLSPQSYHDDWGGGVEANCEYRLKTDAGAVATVRLSYTHDLRNYVCVRGSKGELSTDHDGERVQLKSVETGLTALLSASEPFSCGDWPPTLRSCFLEQLSLFDRALQSRGAAHTTAREAARTARLIDWAYAHHQRRTATHRSDDPAVALQPGRIVITGGTGFVGGHLVERLASIGHDDLVLPVRSYRSGANPGRFPVQMVRTNLLDRESLGQVMAGARYVFHLAYGRDGDDASRVTVDGTRNVVDAAIAVGAESVVVLSTTALFGDPGSSSEVDETFPYAPGNEYERLKADAERSSLERAARASATRIAVLNSACVYGPRGGPFTELPARCLKEGRFCWIEDGRGLVNYVFVDNLIDAILLAATRTEAHAQRFIVSDGVTTWRDYFTRLFGPRVEGLASFTALELEALVRRGAPRVRELAAAVAGSPEVRRIIRENPTLAGVKSAARSAVPGLFQRVRRIKSAEASAASTAAARTPPTWLAQLYPVTKTRFTSEKAHRLLGWRSRVGLDEGLDLSRSWLEEMDLLDARPNR